MSLSYASRVFQTSTTAGTGSYVLAAGPVGMRTFVAGVGTGKKVPYLADDGTDWESGIGTTTAGAGGGADTLTRDRILASSNGGAAIAWGSNTKNIRLAPPAELYQGRDEKGNSILASGAVGGTANAHTVTFSPAPIGYSDGERLDYFAPAANTGPITVNKNALGAKAVKIDGQDIPAGAVRQYGLMKLVYSETLGWYEAVALPSASLPTFAMLAADKDKILNGLILSNNASDATNDIDISAGACVSDDGTTIIAIPAMTKQLDATFAEGNNNGAMESGTAIADGTFHLWAIFRPDTKVPGYLFSASATAPTLPTNYTKKKRVGSIIRKGSTILPFIQDGNRFNLQTPILDVNDTTNSTTSVTAALSVPQGLRVLALLTVGTPTTQGFVYVSDIKAVDLAPSSTAAPLATVVGPPSGNYPLVAHAEVYTDTSRQVRYRRSANTTAYILTRGWIDLR